jgi:hypothetical protein
VFVDAVGEFLRQTDEWKDKPESRPTAAPWKLLEKAPKPPSKKFVSIKAIFE